MRYKIMSALLVVLLFAGCASKPKTPPVEPTPEPVIQVETVSRAALDASLAEATAQRKKAFDRGFKDLLPEDWALADEPYVAGKASYDTYGSSADVKDAKAAIASFGDATAKFGKLIEKGLPLLAERAKAEAEAMRKVAVAEDAETLSPELLDSGDAAFKDGEGAMSEPEKAITAFTRAIDYFDAAYKRSATIAVKSRIDELGYGEYDSGNYALAEEKLASAESMYDTDTGKAIDSLEEALLRYRLVLGKGWELVALGNKDRTDEAKRLSDSIKADVAVRDDYSVAQSTYEAARAALATGNTEESASLFEDSEGKFQAVYETALEKRNAAESAIMAAEASAEASSEKAQAADAAIGAGN